MLCQMMPVMPRMGPPTGLGDKVERDASLTIADEEPWTPAAEFGNPLPFHSEEPSKIYTCRPAGCKASSLARVTVHPLDARGCGGVS